MKCRHDDVTIVFYESVYKTCQRQPTELKLSKLIAHSSSTKYANLKTM